MQLTHAALAALVALVIARDRGPTGFVPVNRVTIYRLREAIATENGSEGRHLIETGCGEEYRLAP